jgi:hypothetical protein
MTGAATPAVGRFLDTIELTAARLLAAVAACVMR